MTDGLHFDGCPEEYANKRQREYIRREVDKIRKVRKAWDSYVNLTYSMNLHPLDGGEIWQRERELDEMNRTLCDKERVK